MATPRPFLPQLLPPRNRSNAPFTVEIALTLVALLPILPFLTLGPPPDETVEQAYVKMGRFAPPPQAPSLHQRCPLQVAPAEALTQKSLKFT